jgi:hypothetical protein
VPDAPGNHCAFRYAAQRGLCFGQGFLGLRHIQLEILEVIIRRANLCADVRAPFTCADFQIELQRRDLLEVRGKCALRAVNLLLRRTQALRASVSGDVSNFIGVILLFNEGAWRQTCALRQQRRRARVVEHLAAQLGPLAVPVANDFQDRNLSPAAGIFARLLRRCGASAGTRNVFVAEDQLAVFSAQIIKRVAFGFSGSRRTETATAGVPVRVWN